MIGPLALINGSKTPGDLHQLLNENCAFAWLLVFVNYKECDVSSIAKFIEGDVSILTNDPLLKLGHRRAG